MLVQSFSGIRGVYGKTLTDDIARRYAYCYYQFIKKRKSSNLEDAETSRLWRHRANFQKDRIEGILPDSELSRALKFLIDKSFEL